MKKFFLLGMALFLGSCVVSQDEIQSLKIKVINLETRLATQEQKSQELEKEISKNLNNKLLEIRSQLLSEIEEIKKEHSELLSKLEEVQFKSEEKDKEYLSRLKELNLKIETLETKVSSFLPILENATKITNATKIINGTKVENATTLEGVIQIKNATQIENTTKIEKATKINNATQNQKVSQDIKLKEDELFQKAHTLFQKGDYKTARTLWEEYLKRFPKGKWIGQAYFGIGETYFKEKNYEDAILSYQKLIELPGPHPQKPTAMLRQAQAFKALGDQKAYQILLKKIIKEFPTSKEASQAKKLLAK